MTNIPVRRGQLIAPFGVGAMLVDASGTGLITAGLDHWYDDRQREVDVNEFRTPEWRLVERLGVDHFRLPPDYRRPRRGVNNPNTSLKVPFLRFPQWHYCPTCRRMEKLPLTTQRSIPCSECKKKDKTRYVVQVPLVAMCERGHLQDFPWKEWVHRSVAPVCDRPLRLLATGGASLGAQKIICECGKERTLSGITIADSEAGTTVLSETLESADQPFLCQGRRPWLGTEEGEPCDMPLRGSLRSASNVYYADIKSAIHVPRGQNAVSEEILAILDQPPYAATIPLLAAAAPEKITPENLRRVSPVPLRSYSDLELAKAIDAILNPPEMMGNDVEVEEDEKEIVFRRAEFNTLRRPQQGEKLFIQGPGFDQYQEPVPGNFAKVMLVPKLRETRAFAGFSRVYAESKLAPEERRRLLWRDPPGSREWLPAYVVTGEGIFLELDEGKLQEWEQREDVIKRIGALNERYNRARSERQLPPRLVSPRFVLLHTFAHLLMNRLTFECGYSSASLRERLYVSPHAAQPMAGILIYTAAGDAEGTMGGLVRMGKPGFLEPTVQRALEEARWCSVDPVCMELGERGGQGPNSCNLAACHNCALVPETACEEFNQLLDRALVVGVPGNREMGYFAV